jgi:gas vesicle protein
MENSKTAGLLIGGLILGAAIGATLGILFAPDKGSVTRKKLCDKSKGLKDSLKEKINDLVESLNNESQIQNGDVK